MNVFDATAWIGPWPFAVLPEHTAASLTKALREHGIQRALVSPLRAVFAPEPGPANQALLRRTRSATALTPLPVLNPILPGWRDELDTLARDPRVRAVRWLPAYHGYSLRARELDVVVAALRERDLRLVITARLIDERHEYFALRLKPVPSTDLAAFLQRHPDWPVLVSGLTFQEALNLAPQYPRLLVDCSFAEWDRTLERWRETIPADQIVFGSHTPFLVTAATTAKLMTARLPAREHRAIAAGNLEAFLCGE